MSPAHHGVDLVAQAIGGSTNCPWHVTAIARHIGGGLALLRTGDRVRVDLKTRRADMLVPEDEIARRRAAWKPDYPASQTPWQEIYRQTVGQLSSGACMELATRYHKVADKVPRHSH